VDDVLRRCDAGVFHSRASLAGPKLAKIDCFLSGGVEGGRDMKMGMRFRVRHACILSLPAGTRCLSELMAPRKCASARTISLVPVLACLHAQDSLKHGIPPRNRIFFWCLFFAFPACPGPPASRPLGSRWAPHDVKHRCAEPWPRPRLVRDLSLINIITPPLRSARPRCRRTTVAPSSSTRRVPSYRACKTW
jgi:hypothetical protein